MKAAEKAYKSWSKTSPHVRARHLYRSEKPQYNTCILIITINNVKDYDFEFFLLSRLNVSLVFIQKKVWFQFLISQTIFYHTRTFLLCRILHNVMVTLIVFSIARHIQKHMRLFNVVESLDNGKTIRETRDADIPIVVRHFYHHAGWAQLMETEMRGWKSVGKNRIKI